MNRYTLSEVRASYTPEKAREEWHGDWISALLYRPISFWITPPLLNLGVSASQVTGFALLLALLLPLLALLGNGVAHVWVAALATLFVILDCVDGNIARVRKSASKSGHYLDFVTDLVFRVCLYGALGMLAEREASPLWMDGLSLAACFLAALIAISARLCRTLARQWSEGDVYAPDNAPVRGFVGRFLLPALSGMDRLLPFLILAGSYWEGLRWVAVWLVVYSALDCAYTQVAIFRRLARA